MELQVVDIEDMTIQEINNRIKKLEEYIRQYQRQKENLIKYCKDKIEECNQRKSDWMLDIWFIKKQAYEDILQKLVKE